MRINEAVLFDLFKAMLAGVVIYVLARLFEPELNERQRMSILYPVMTATGFLATVVMLLYYISVRPVRLVLSTVFYLASETAVLLLLSLTTGAHPVLDDIGQYRSWVVWARLCNWLSLIWMIYEGANMVFRCHKQLTREAPCDSDYTL